GGTACRQLSGAKDRTFRRHGYRYSRSPRPCRAGGEVAHNAGSRWQNRQRPGRTPGRVAFFVIRRVALLSPIALRSIRGLADGKADHETYETDGKRRRRDG